MLERLLQSLGHERFSELLRNVVDDNCLISMVESICCVHIALAAAHSHESDDFFININGVDLVGAGWKLICII
jgi:hypothetical protein